MYVHWQNKEDEVHLGEHQTIDNRWKLVMMQHVLEEGKGQN